MHAYALTKFTLCKRNGKNDGDFERNVTPMRHPFQKHILYTMQASAEGKLLRGGVSVG